MDNNHPIVWLTFFTLASGVVIVLGAFLYFLRSRHNRHAASRALVGTGHEHTGPAPDGAAPELFTVLLVALVVMALLGFGYAYR